MQSISKFRNVYGEASKEKCEGIKPSENTTEGSLIDCNSHFIGVSCSASGGGCVAVLDALNLERLKNDTPMIKGHTAPVAEVKFSPFRPNLLATGSDDTTVRLWEIPEGGLVEDITVEQQKFTGHSKKVHLLSYSPTVDELIASASFDNTVNVWNICNGTSYSKVNFNDTILSLDWNHNGSLLGLTSRSKMVHVVDPRANKVEMEVKAHESTKSQKMGFLNENFLFTSGFSKVNERQLKLFDMRKFTEPAQTVYVDSQAGVMMPYFDPDTGLIFLPGKGEGNIKYFDFTNSTIKTASEYRSNVPQKGICFFAKRSMNYNKCEIVRAAKLTNNSFEYVSFYVPRRNESYDASLYPDCISGEPALGLEEWLKGENREPVRKNITALENNWSVNAMTFQKKEEDAKVEEKKANTENDSNHRVSELERMVKEYEAKISELNLAKFDLTTQLKLEQDKNAELQAEINNLKSNSQEEAC